MARRTAGVRSVIKFGGFIILILVSIKLSFSDLDGLLSHIPDEYNIYLLLTGTGLAVIGLLLTSVYKRLPFWVNLVSALGLVFLSLLPSGWTIHFNDGMCIAGAVILFLAARFVSGRHYINTKVFSIVVPLLVFILVLFTGRFNGLGADVAYNGELFMVENGVHKIFEEIEEIGGSMDEAEAKPEESSEEEVEDESDEEAVGKVEDTLFEEYLRELELINQRISELEFEKAITGDVAQVKTIAAAVNPSSPVVRDFAVKIASAVPGSYYRGGGEIPSREGIAQVLAIHRYVTGRWSYINDPLYARGDYYSSADRTIGLGLAGDCDDYSILLASCVEAVGGKARILGGTCGEGGHAWCEVYLGDKRAWEQAVSMVGGGTSRSASGGGISHILFPSDSAYWISLDWSAGKHSCGNNPSILYQSGRKR